MSKLHHPDRFKHVRYDHTDVTKTWDRERKRLAGLKAQAEADAIEAKSKTTQLRRKA